MEAGIADHLWTIEEAIGLLERANGKKTAQKH
jgi:hypothetical protein